MPEVQRLETPPVLPESCSQEELQELEAIGTSGMHEVEDYFSKKNAKIPDKTFQEIVKKLIGGSVDTLSLTLFLTSQKKREDFLRKMDDGKTKRIEQEIISGKDIKPLLMEMIGIEIAINTPSDIALVEIVTKYETGKRNMTENEYSNYLFGTKLHADTVVLFDGVKTSFLEAQKILIKQAIKTGLDELKSKCET